MHDLIDCCVGSRGSHYDVARVVRAVLGNTFKYDGNNTWYFVHPESGQWILDENRQELETRIRIDVCHAFTERAYYWQNVSIDAQTDMSLKIDAQLRSVKLMHICLKIGKERFLRELMKECRSFFVTDE